MKERDKDRLHGKDCIQTVQLNFVMEEMWWHMSMKWYFQWVTQAYSEKEIPSSPNRSRTFDLTITRSDALPLSCMRVAGAKAIKGHVTLFSACAAIWFLIRRNSFQSKHLRRKSFSIDLVRLVEVKITISRNCLVICEGFKPHILYFYLNIVEKFDVLERRYSNRLWTKAPVAS